MKILDKYLIKNLTKNVLSVLLILVIIFFLFSFLDELREVGGSSFYTFEKALLVVVLKIPTIIYTLSYLAILIGVIMSIGNMNTNKELQIYLSGSISIYAIVKKVVISSFIISLIFFFLGEFTSSVFLSKAENFKSSFLSEEKIYIERDSFWMKKDGRFIYLGNRKSNREFNENYIFDVENDKLMAINYSDLALLENDNITIRDLSVIDLSADSRGKNKLFFSNKDKISIPFQVNNLDRIDVKPSYMNFIELWRQISFLSENRLDSKEHRIDLYSRLLKPINLIALIIFALPLVMRFDRAISVGKRIFIGIFLALLLNMFLKVVTQILNKFVNEYFLTMTLITLMLLSVSIFFTKLRFDKE